MSNISIESFIKTITALFITTTEAQEAKKGKVSLEALLESFNLDEVQNQLKNLLKKGMPKQCREKKRKDKNQCVKFITDNKLNKLIFNSCHDECCEDECSEDECSEDECSEDECSEDECSEDECSEDENAPKRPKSGYMFFAEKKRPEIKEAQPELKMSEIAKTIGERWKSAVPATKMSEISGYKSTYKNSSYHSYNDLPAISKGQLSEWYTDGKLDRQGDKPAIIDGLIREWWVNGKCHREGDKPAYVDENHKEWYKDGKIHRDNDFPALVNDYCEVWYNNGKRHRGNGLPALILKNGYKEWWVDDICIFNSTR